MYILGQPLTIITDNKALTFMHKCHLNNSRITRWILAIQEYNFDIIHCKEKDNVVADILSRYPADAEQHETNEETHEYLINHLAVKMNQHIGKIIRDIGKYQNDDDKLRTTY